MPFNFKSVIIFLLLQLQLQLIQVVLASQRSVDLRIKHLRAESGSPFKVAVFSDLHFGESAWTDWGPKQDLNSLRVMSRVLDAENPDLVVYLGDLITANNIPIANASMYWELATSAARERGIPWATVLETMMMHNLFGLSNGFQQLLFLHLIARLQLTHSGRKFVASEVQRVWS